MCCVTTNFKSQTSDLKLQFPIFLLLMSQVIKEEVERLLPLIKQGEVTPATLEELTGKVRQAMKDDPTQGKVLGPLLAQISAAVKAQVVRPDVNWVAVEKGRLAIGHK